MTKEERNKRLNEILDVAKKHKVKIYIYTKSYT